jgi:hypothetical protein
METAAMKWRQIDERISTGGVEPIKPLTTKQARKRSEKTRQITRKIADVRAKSAERISDLQARKASVR